MPRFYRNADKSEKFSLSGDTKPTCVFLAEGEAEAFFFESLLAYVEADPTRNVALCFRGLGNFSPFLHVLTQEPNFSGVTALGVMLDADDDYAGRAASVTALLKSTKILSAGAASPVANIVASNGRRTAVFVSPGANRVGAIESIVIDEIRRKAQWNCIDAFSHCIHEQFENPPNPKTIAQIYISLMKPRMCGIGRAFDAGVFDVSDPAYATARAVFQ